MTRWAMAHIFSLRHVLFHSHCFFSQIEGWNSRSRFVRFVTMYIWLHGCFYCRSLNTVHLFLLFITLLGVDSTVLLVSTDRHLKTFHILTDSNCLSNALNSSTSPFCVKFCWMLLKCLCFIEQVVQFASLILPFFFVYAPFKISSLQENKNR